MNEMYIEEDKDVLQAMKQLDVSARKILFVHDNEKLLAVVTDGDIRRWILQNGDLHASVKCVANYQPKYLYENQIEMIQHVLNEYQIDAIPVVDNNKRIKKIIFRNEKEVVRRTFSEDIPVVIMAGGMGTRLAPYTNILPKPLIPIGEIPIAEHIINRFKEYGCKDFYMIVNYKRNMIKAYFDDTEKDYSLKFVCEEKKLGTGGGISLLKGKVESTFILTNCDILIDDDLTKAYKRHKEADNKITMICSLKNFTIPYGIINVKEDGSIDSMQEKPEMSFLTNTGCYIVEPEIINEMQYNEPIDFPMLIDKCRAEGQKVGVYPISENAWLDMGQVDELENMKKRLGC